ncbi:MAG: tetratricopeptide repeat protein [Caulobacterales bacterium]|jgi:predicted Zn-dependent protease|nr:tetratricopeptide repeat protein [Caulobacterales bacterium]
MDTDAILTEAESALRGGDLNAAEAVLTRSWPDIAKMPGDALHLLADIRFRSGKAADAESLLRAATKVEPDSQRHHIALGHTLASAGNFKAACESYRRALQINEAWPGLLRTLSQTALDAGDLVEAERAARRLIDTAPTAMAWSALSSALRAQAKGAEALAAADEGIRLEPNERSVQHSRGASLLMVGRAAEALTIFQELVANGVREPVLSVNHGTALLMLGRRSEADAVFDDALKRWPHAPNLRAQIAARRR